MHWTFHKKTCRDFVFLTFCSIFAKQKRTNAELAQLVEQRIRPKLDKE